MSFIDIAIFCAYIIGVMIVGWYYYLKNESNEDYYVGGRNMSSFHVGLSVVATDVGGGFSIGLGGLGFVMGISGSWMLFTGLVGAWLASVFLIPKVIKMGHMHKLLTFPQLLRQFYGQHVAFLAGIISFVGYLGFTSSQLLAGAKLATGTFPALSMENALIIMGVVAVVYTVAGGIKAVIYTDTFQWLLLMGGLICIGIPMAYIKLGGMSVIRESLPDDFLSFTNLTGVQFINWLITIVPIWFIGMTLYQRIFSCKDERTAKRAWYIAGLFEYPVMAFMGVLLGVFARVAADAGMFAEYGFASGSIMAETDSEMGLPLLLRSILPVGLTGLMMSAYFSAIMSTADSCLMAASGNFVTDILGLKSTDKNVIRVSQAITLIIGVLAILLAYQMQNVLTLMLNSYAFMVSGLFVPVLGMLFAKKVKPAAALAAMLAGGVGTLTFSIFDSIPIPFGFDPIIVGITLSAIVFLAVNSQAK
ncbi:sodium:solute symporter family protein [Sinomicrobium weinanense]|uniref:Sodium:solute symporter family protein n=1 Tax=Sinomicrobium weinanense TaxID=2842200 RepID=A0A926JNQ6_9FLAO|nr:sodium:solute symporter family protein [Sinomicrobium weinanense]MBC9794523.1 sodium:solute symporter family protein [Sinomicrobium weinanense]MBU3124430.1 sodium:solute symporter family protein [Sinomicrobium weinanense]